MDRTLQEGGTNIDESRKQKEGVGIVRARGEGGRARARWYLQDHGASVRLGQRARDGEAACANREKQQPQKHDLICFFLDLI